MERDVAVKRSKSSRRRRAGSKRMRTVTRRAKGKERDSDGTGMEIKKNPTIISPAKNATTYVEDGTGTLEPEG